MLTPLGAEAITDAPSAPPASVPPPSRAQDGRLIVQPSFEVLLFQFDPRVYRLVQFAQIKRLGPVSTFALTQAALLRGLEAGNQVDQILAWLSECTHMELPQNVVYTLRDWSRGYREAHLEDVILVELSPAQGEDTLYRVLADLECIEPRKLAPGMFVVPRGHNTVVELRGRLEKEGLVVRGESAPKPSCW